MGKTYDSGQFEGGAGPRARARRLAGLRRTARAGAASAGVCAAAASPRSSNGPAPTCSRSASRSTVHRRWRDRDLLGDAGDGSGSADHVRATGRRRVRRADRPDPDRAGRHRSRHGLRQRRIALALRRRLGGARRGGAHRRQRRRIWPPRRWRPRAGDIDYRRWRLHHRRHRSSHRPVRPRAPAAADSASCSIRPARSPMRHGPTAATSAKSRSTRRPGDSLVAATGRSTTSGASSIRMIVAASSTAARSRASDRHCASSFVYDRELRRRRSAPVSWTTRCRGRA